MKSLILILISLTATESVMAQFSYRPPQQMRTRPNATRLMNAVVHRLSELIAELSQMVCTTVNMMKTKQFIEFVKLRLMTLESFRSPRDRTEFNYASYFIRQSIQQPNNHVLRPRFEVNPFIDLTNPVVTKCGSATCLHINGLRYESSCTTFITGTKLTIGLYRCTRSLIKQKKNCNGMLIVLSYINERGVRCFRVMLLGRHTCTATLKAI